MDISNKTLALFLLGAIVVSLGGTILSLNKLGEVTTTGLVTQPGQVDLEILSSLSITTEDNSVINFGTCTPPAGQTTIINSEGLENTTSVCGAYGGSGIYVRNNGNVNANVTIRSNVVGAAEGGEFLNSTIGTSSLQYKTVGEGDGSFTNGCQTGLVGSYTAFAEEDEEYLVCGNLTAGATANSFETHIQIVLPSDVPPGEQGATLTFFAEQVD